jgi:hypothetical protein
MIAAACSPRSAAEIASMLDSQPAVTVRSGRWRVGDKEAAQT